MNGTRGVKLGMSNRKPLKIRSIPSILTRKSRRKVHESKKKMNKCIGRFFDKISEKPRRKCEKKTKPLLKYDVPRLLNVFKQRSIQFIHIDEWVNDKSSKITVHTNISKQDISSMLFFSPGDRKMLTSRNSQPMKVNSCDITGVTNLITPVKKRLTFVA